MRIATFGATGGCGRATVALAAAEGHIPIAIRRSPADPSQTGATPDGQTQLGETRVCQPYENHAIDDALAGVDAVISCIGIRRRNPFNPWSPLASPADTTAVCTRHILAAMGRAGIERIACISAAGVADSCAACSLPIRQLIERTNLSPAYDDLAEMERLLAESDRTWLALRPTTLISLGPAKAPRPTTRYGLFSITPRRAVARALLDFATANARAHSATAMVTS